MREAAHEALAILRHEADERMAQSQYRHFLSLAEEGAEVMILSTGGHDHMGCFTDQVKLTRALVRNLDKAIKEVKLLGKHEEESSQKITKLEALCKKLREDTQRLEEDKATLEEMVESHDELLMEIARETRLDHMGEDGDEEEDADDGGDATTPPVAAPPPPTPLLPCLRRSTKRALWRQSLSKNPQSRMRSS
jgi:DNA repair exonuclease SbcCD ATPase subunit